MFNSTPLSQYLNIKCVTWQRRYLVAVLGATTPPPPKLVDTAVVTPVFAWARAATGALVTGIDLIIDGSSGELRL